MAEIKTALIAILNGSPAVYTAFGNRITADKLPDVVTYPCARVWTVAGVQAYNMSEAGVQNIIAQIDVYDDDIAGADTNTELIKTALSGYRGNSNGFEIGKLFVRNIAGMWNSEARNYHRILELEIGANG